jgi:glycine cleavage system H lipoate-binding protein
VKEKLYTEDHEWIEMSADGKTCMSIHISHLPYDFIATILTYLTQAL